MKKLLCAGLAVLLAVTLASCSKDKTTDLEGEWLFPVAKGSLSINTISQLRDLEYHVRIPAPSINQPENIPVSSPGLRLAHVGPFPVRIIDWLKRMDVDTLEFTGSLQNFFPIPIGPGTIVTMRNTRDTIAANIVGTAFIGQTVLPGQTFSFDISVRGKTLYDSVYFFLDNFNSPAYSNVTFSTTPTQLDVTLKVITASYAEFYTSKTFSSRDTLDFDASGRDDVTNSSAISDTSTSGTINVFTDNGLPAAVTGQLYFLDAFRHTLLDSLFIGNLNVVGGRTDLSGNTTYTDSRMAVVAISRQKLERIKAAKYVATAFTFSTMGYPGIYVAANRSSKLVIQFTGDLNLRIHF